MEEQGTGGAQDAQQKIRSSDPDLTIVLKYITDDDDDQEHEKEYDVYSQILANKSKFVDACLLAEMQEKKNRRIVLDGISPAVFEKGMAFLDDSVASRSMTAQDALTVIGLYDKYEFTKGMELCDQVLCDFFPKEEYYSHELEYDKLDMAIDIAVAADKHNLSESKKTAVYHIEMVIGGTNNCSFEDVLYAFDLDRIKRLCPLFQSGVISHGIEGVTEEELNSPLFPKLWLEHKRLQLACEAASVLTLRGTKTGADGAYLRRGYNDDRFEVLRSDPSSNRNFTRNLQLIIVRADESDAPLVQEGDWCICGEDDSIDDDNHIIFWHSPDSKMFSVPPKGGWKSLHDLAKNRHLEVKYKPSIHHY